MYANLTNDQRAAIRSAYKRAAAMCRCPDVQHHVAIAAMEVLSPHKRGWNGKKGSNAFAAAMTSLVFGGVLTLAESPEPTDLEQVVQRYEAYDARA